MFTSSALRNMDPSLEEAAEISGATAFSTLFTVTFPLIMPAIVSGMLLSFIVMLGIYGIPAGLGPPINLSVLTTSIFQLTNWPPPLYNTVAVGIITAGVGGTLAFAIGYTIHRTNVFGRRSIGLVSTLPVAIPGLVVGVAYLWAWIGIPGGLYGTIWILALAFIARFMPDTVKALSTSFLQIHRELEEAAWVCGKGTLGTIRTIVLPLARPSVIAAMTLLFVLAIRELVSSLFLYTSNTMVIAVLLIDYYEGGNLGKTAAFSLVQMVLLGVLIAGANLLVPGAAQGSVARSRCINGVARGGRF